MSTAASSHRKARESELAEEGRALCQAIYAATKLVSLYGPDSQVVSESTDTLIHVIRRVRDTNGDTKIRVSSSTMFLNGNRVKMNFDGFLSFQYVVDLMTQLDVGEIRFRETAGTTDVLYFLQAMLAVRRETEDVLDTLRAQMEEVGVRGIELARRRNLGNESDDSVVADLRESGIQLYFKASFIARMLLENLGKSATAARKAKRIVHNIVDVLDRDERVLLTLTGVKAFEDFHSTHAVNVCILSMCLGRRVGLHKRDIAELGMGGLVHDAGRTLGEDVEPGADAEHTRRGARHLLKAMGFSDGSLRAVLTALHHHDPAMDEEGRRAGLYARIIAVADFFDTETTAAGAGRPPRPARKVLAAMTRDPRRFDPRLARLLASVVGAYPLGTVVFLDTGERAIVCGRNPHFDAPLRPVVRVLEDADGQAVEGGPELDLSTFDREAKSFAHSIEEAYSPAEAFETPAALIAQI